MMSRGLNKDYWLIQGWDSYEKLFEEKIPIGSITEKSLKELLKALTAKIGLSEKEIVSSYAKKRTKMHHNHLDVQFLQGKQYMYSCGSNPYVTAEVVRVKISYQGA